MNANYISDWFILSSDFQEDASQSWQKSSTVCTDVIKVQTQKNFWKMVMKLLITTFFSVRLIL